VLLLGIGNVLMGDEGVGVFVARRLAERTDLPPEVTCVDGGTGGLALLDAVQGSDTVILVDATADGAPVGTVRRLRPRWSADYPRTLTAHDIGLKDLLDTVHLLGNGPDVHLYTISIEPPDEVGTDLSSEAQAAVDRAVEVILADLPEITVRG
jgi:hydrogenase maturation protease